MKKFIERARGFLSATKEVLGNTLQLGLGYGLMGGLVIGGISALFISAPFTSLFIFGAAATTTLVGGGYFLGNMVQSMFSTGDHSKYNRKMLAGTLLLAASATTLYVNGTPRAAAENARSISSDFNCAPEKTVRTVSQDAQGRPVVTMTCRP